MFDLALYTIGWICAIPCELTAARLHLDGEHPSSEHEAAPGDNNTYVFGNIGEHHVVIATLPDGEYGLSSAATVAKDMIRSIPNLKIGLMVGIGGGAPLMESQEKKQDVRLGDVVVSRPENGKGGVYQFDYGKTIQNLGFIQTGHLNSPPQSLRGAVSVLKSDFELSGNNIEKEVEKLLSTRPAKLRKIYARPDDITDRLYKASYPHVDAHQSCLVACDGDREIIVRDSRDEIGEEKVSIHYGLIASANTLMKNAKDRESFARENGILCFEMEAAGLMNQLPFLVVRGICDYSDTHKNKEWQGYAAMTAAAYARKLLLRLPPAKVAVEARLSELKEIKEQMQEFNSNLEVVRSNLLQQTTSSLRADIVRWLAAPDPETNFQSARDQREPGTGQWLTESKSYLQWKAGSIRHIWYCGKAGCGKSVLSASVIEDIRNHCANNPDTGYAIFYFTFSDSSKQSYINCLRSVVYQLSRNESVSSSLEKLFKMSKNRQDGDSRVEEDLQNILLNGVQSHKSFFLILDGLDESPWIDAKGIKHREKLLEWLQTLSSKLPSLQILATSRQLPDIKEHLEMSFHSESMITECINADIGKYVVNQLNQDQRLHDLNADTKREIEEIFIKEANGMFRWAICQMDHLKTIPSTRPSHLKEALNHLPASLDEVYNTMINGIPHLAKDIEEWYPVNLPSFDVQTTTIDTTPLGFFDSSRFSGEDSSGVGTDYTDQSNAGDIGINRVGAIVDDLGQRLLAVPGIIMPNGISATIPSLLEDFALRLGHEGSSQDHLNAMRFIHRYRLLISEQLQDFVWPTTKDEKDDEDSNKDLKDPQPDMTYDEKFTFWNLKDEPPEMIPEPINDHADMDGQFGDKLESDEFLNSEKVDTYRDLVLSSSAYAWLIHRLLSELRLTKPFEKDARQAIRETILSLKPRQKLISRHSPPSTLSMRFVCKWNLTIFLKEQTSLLQARGLLSDQIKTITLSKIEQAITLVGNLVDAQGFTCGEYLHLVWPQSGLKILELLKAADVSHQEKLTAILSDNTKLSACVIQGVLSVDIAGEIHAVAETVEILAWITSALQASQSMNICAITPSIQVASVSRDVANETTTVDRVVHIKFAMEDLEAKHDSASCWYKMFNNPVVVQGYPIQRRDELGSGLECSLDLILAVMNTNRWIILNSKLYIRSFSSTLVPTRMSDNAIQWHYMYDTHGKYLWFENNIDIHVEDVNPIKLESQRHFIGWCSTVKSRAGTREHARNTNIKSSGLDVSTSSIALKGFSLAGGHFGASIGMNIAVGNKDLPICLPLTGQGIGQKLVFMADQAVVLWDTEDKRGWLVDGSSALLLLIRVYLKGRWTGNARKAFLLQEEQIIEPTTEYPDAALDFFLDNNMKNMQLVLDYLKFEKTMETSNTSNINPPIKSKVTYLLMQDLVEGLIDVLLHTVELQYKKRLEGVYFEPHYHMYLDGWDFKKIATGQRNLRPISQSMDCRTLPWVDFVRSIDGITLFGKGFGEIIEPAGSVCSHWQKLPTGKDYLAACVATIDNIIERYEGDSTSRPIQLTSNLPTNFEWRSPTGTFEPCLCKKYGKQEDSVQVIWLSNLNCPSYPAQSTAYETYKQGAVVFGRHQEPLWRRWRGVLGRAFVGDPDCASNFTQEDPAASEVQSNDIVSDQLSPLSETTSESYPASATLGSSTTSPGLADHFQRLVLPDHDIDGSFSMSLPPHLRPSID